jgi:hypothetical protein
LPLTLKGGEFSDVLPLELVLSLSKEQGQKTSENGVFRDAIKRISK